MLALYQRFQKGNAARAQRHFEFPAVQPCDFDQQQAGSGNWGLLAFYSGNSPQQLAAVEQSTRPPSRDLQSERNISPRHPGLDRRLCLLFQTEQNYPTTLGLCQALQGRFS
jgi:hypothetical protein